MIRAVLFDLDDTLINSQTQPFFVAYLKLLAAHFGAIVPPGQFSSELLGSYEASLRDYNPVQTLEERFLVHFSESTSTDSARLKTIFADFYDERYSDLRDMVTPVPHARRIIQDLHNNGIICVIATNPALPLAAIRQRMIWGGIDPDDPAISLITSLESMRFGKPQPEYYEEILLQLGISAHEAIMVGNSQEQDIIPAQISGLHTYFIDDQISHASDDKSLAGFERYLQQNAFGDGAISPVMTETLMARLAAFPAAIDHLRRSAPQGLLDCRPGAREWSVRDIVFHLVDHETEEDQARLEMIVDSDNPFLSTNYDPWTHIHEYDSLSLEDGLARFVDLRKKTLDWLNTLEDSVWSRPARSPIMGPTTFREMVQFITEHDRTHLRQMKESLAVAMALC